MKLKSLLLAIIMVLVCVMSACTVGNNNSNGGESSSQKPSFEPQEAVLPTNIPEVASEPSIQIHYRRKSSSDYLKWGFWIWADGKDGDLYEMNYQDNFGGVAIYPVSTFIADFDGTGVIGLIPRLLSSWTKDVDTDRMWDLSQFVMDQSNYYHVYISQGDAELYMTDQLEVIPRINSANFITEKEISVSTSVAVSNVKVYENGSVLVESKGYGALVTRVSLPAGYTPNFDSNYTIEVTFKQGGTAKSDISVSGLYGTDSFNDKYYYDGELGAIYTQAKTTFKVWSPVSTSITLKLYKDSTKSDQVTTYKMEKGDKGVYEVTVDGDLEGMYYTYFVTNSKYPNGREVVDPYAKSAGVNGTRGQIVDFSKTNPEGWDQVEVKNYDRKELTVWETHVADVTSSSTWTGTESYRKKFLGMIESGTTYTENGVTVTTGFDHIKELGVNAVQLVPIFDQANDEVNTSFNWGYNPLNYNVLEGSYSTDPTNGYTRINEFKQVVQAFNGAGINLIMDVVYNHVNGLEGSNFDVLMPGYYFRYNTNGKASNGSGCGNETASENLMFRKFMIDSACFWAKEYKLGGFRFDLMGLHDIETMNLLVEKLQEINPDIVVYGEPWTGGTTTLASDKQAKQDNGNKFVGYGQFNDQMRDALIKGGLCGADERGWITNYETVNTTDVTKIIQGIKGITGSTIAIADPNKTLNYVTCHDNYTLYDRIVAAGITDEQTIAKMAVLANSIVFTSQGTTFMLAGEEFLRTKGGSHNSYNESYQVNELDYSLKVKNLNVFKAYQKLIWFKQNVATMHLEQDQMSQFTVNYEQGGSCIKISFTSDGKEYVVYHLNGTATSTEISVEGYTLYLDTLDPLSEGFEQSTTVLMPYQTLIMYK